MNLLRAVAAVGILLLGSDLAAPAAAETRLELWSIGRERPGNQLDLAATLNAVARPDAVVTAIAGEAMLARLKSEQDAIFKVRAGEVALLELPLAALFRFSGLYAIDQIPFIAADLAGAVRLRDAARDLLTRRLDEDGLLLLAIVPGVREQLALRQLGPDGLAAAKGQEFAVIGAAHQRVMELLGGVPHRKRSAAPNTWLQFDPASPPPGGSTTVVDASLQWRLLVLSKSAAAKLPAAMLDRFRKAAAGEEARLWQQVRDVPPPPLASKVLSERELATLEAIGWQMAEEWAVAAGADGVTILQTFKASRDRTP